MSVFSLSYAEATVTTGRIVYNVYQTLDVSSSSEHSACFEKTNPLNRVSYTLLDTPSQIINKNSQKKC